MSELGQNAGQQQQAQGQSAGQQAGSQQGQQQQQQGSQQQDWRQHVPQEWTAFEKRNIPAEYGGDINKVISTAKQVEEYRRNGFDAFIQQATERGFDGYMLASALLGEGQAGGGAQQTDAEAVAAQQAALRQQQGQQGQQEPKPLTQADVDALVNQRLEQRFQAESTRQKSQAARKTEIETYGRTLDDLGYKPNPQKVTLFGQETQMDPFRELVYEPALQAMTQRVIERSLNPNDPRYFDKLNAPATPQQIAAAAKEIQWVLAALKQSGLMAQADQQQHLPNASLGGGPGGRAQKPVSEMTQAEREAEAFRRARAKGKIPARAG